MATFKITDRNYRVVEARYIQHVSTQTGGPGGANIDRFAVEILETGRVALVSDSEADSYEDEDVETVGGEVEPMDVHERMELDRLAAQASGRSTEIGCEAVSPNGLERCVLTQGHADRHCSPWGAF